MPEDKDPYETFTSETMKRAEEMCAGLSVGLSLDRRGEATMYDGAITDLHVHHAEPKRVMVAEHGSGETVVVVSHRELAECDRALLVYRRGPTEDCKLIGRLEESRDGQREEDRRASPREYFARFHIVHTAGA